MCNETGDAGEQEHCNRRHSGGHSRQRGEANDSSLRRAQGRARQRQYRVQDHDQHHGLNGEQDALDDRQVGAPDVEHSEQADEQCRRSNERETCRREAHPAGAVVADVHRQFGRRRTWNQVRDAKQIEKLFTRQPRPPAHAFTLDERHVRRRSSEGGEPEPDEQQDDVEQRRSW